MPAHSWRRIAALALALPAAALSACEEENAVVDVTGDHPILNFVTAVAAPSLPGGTLTLAVGIGGFDLTPADAFARGTGALGNYKAVPPFTGRGFDATAAVRNSSQDPRVPALVSSSGAVGPVEGLSPTAFLALFNPVFTGVGPGFWDLFGGVRGLKANTTYTVALARMALAVNGELDQVERLLGLRVAQPDSLYFLGGAESGAETATCDFTTAVSVNTARNPVVLGTITTNANGAATVDCVPFAGGDSPWWRNFTTQTPTGVNDSTPVGINGAGATVKPGQYNYVLIVEGQGTATNKLPDVAPTLRIQLGPDIDASGNAVDETFSPFPIAQVNPNTIKNLPGGTNAFAFPVSLALTIRTLPALSTGTYKAFLVKRSTGASVPATGSYTVDGSAATTQAAFNSPSDTSVHTLAVDEQSAGVAPKDFDRIVLAIETGDVATPSNLFLGFDYLDDRGNAEPRDDRLTTSGSLVFGKPRSEDVERYVPAGSGKGQIFKDSLIVSFRGVKPAPAGWKYQGFMALQDKTGITAGSEVLVADSIAVDENGNVDVRIGGVTLANFNAFILGLTPAIGTPSGLSPFLIHLSEDYKAKFEDFFGAGS
ncbi:MAG: hypothetical protein HY561_11750 [Gemmatimonadetes bacterium]|nr:hypothetical protein [Gemmatimonadota bacterium]